MKIRLILCLLCFTFLFGHEGHQSVEQNKAQQEMLCPFIEAQPSVNHLGGRPTSWAQWIGGFHFIFLHFPIALIIMTAISELLLACSKRLIFDYASRFMIIAAAALAIPTVILGLTYSYTTSYSGLLATFIGWHLWLGISTAILAVFVAFLREVWGVSKLYYVYLFLLFILVNVTGYLGGGMTFGPYHMYPP